MTSGSLASPYRPRPDTLLCLAEWARLAPSGKPVDEIAAAIGMRRDALDRMVCRARKRGDPRAVYHPAARLPGTGTWHIVNRDGRGHRRRTIQKGSR